MKRRASDSAELAVLSGGPWNGWWLTRPRLEDNQAAAKRLGHEPMTSTDTDMTAGVSLNYSETEQWRTNPEGHGDGRVWRWSA